MRPLEYGRKHGQLALRHEIGPPAVSVTIPCAKMPAPLEANEATSARRFLTGKTSCGFAAPCEGAYPGSRQHRAGSPLELRQVGPCFTRCLPQPGSSPG